jgi:hypothetical protein
MRGTVVAGVMKRATDAPLVRGEPHQEGRDAVAWTVPPLVSAMCRRCDPARRCWLAASLGHGADPVLRLNASASPWTSLHVLHKRSRSHPSNRLALHRAGTARGYCIDGIVQYRAFVRAKAGANLGTHAQFVYHRPRLDQNGVAEDRTCFRPVKLQVFSSSPCIRDSHPVETLSLGL